MLVLLAFLTVVPSAMTLVDCPTACRRCRVNADPRDMMLVYCSMCEECRLKARKRRQAARRNLEAAPAADIDNYAPGQGADYMDYEEMYNNPDAASLLDREEYLPEQEPGVEQPIDGQPLRQLEEYYSDVQYNEQIRTESYYKILDSLNIPEGCPTPPICDSDGEPPPTQRLTRTYPTTTTTTTTSTTTTTTVAPLTCPPIPECIQTKRTTRRRRTTVPYEYPVPPPPYPYPCIPQCVMPMCPCPYPPMPMQQPVQPQDQQSSQPQTPSPETSTSKQKLKERSDQMPDQEDLNQDEQDAASDNTYVYLGVPKSMAVQV